MTWSLAEGALRGLLAAAVAWTPSAPLYLLYLWQWSFACRRRPHWRCRLCRVLCDESAKLTCGNRFRQPISNVCQVSQRGSNVHCLHAWLVIGRRWTPWNYLCILQNRRRWKVRDHEKISSLLLNCELLTSRHSSRPSTWFVCAPVTDTLKWWLVDSLMHVPQCQVANIAICLLFIGPCLTAGHR